MRDWVKVWRPRPGSAFEARVSGRARMLFRGMLALFDDDGVMHLPPKPELHEAFGMAHGYTPNERRGLRKPLAELVRHECIRAHQDGDGYWSLTALSWSEYQSKRKGEGGAPAHSPPDPRGLTTVSPRSHHGIAAVSSTETKCPESHDPDLQIRVEEKKIREEVARAREAAPLPKLPSENWDPPTHPEGVWRLFVNACTLAGLDDPGAGGGIRRQQCAEAMRRVPPERMPDDFRAWAEHVRGRDSKPSRPWLNWCDHWGSWAKQNEAREDRRGRGRTVIPDAEATERMLADREQAYRAARARERGPSELTRAGAVKLQLVAGEEPPF